MLVNRVRKSLGLRIRDGSKKLIEDKSWRLSSRMSTVHKNITIQILVTYKYPGMSCLFTNHPPRNKANVILLAIFEFFVSTAELQAVDSQTGKYVDITRWLPARPETIPASQAFWFSGLEIH